MRCALAAVLVALGFGGVARAQDSDDGESPGRCVARRVEIGRVWAPRRVEVERLRLVDCDGAPNERVLRKLSWLARPDEHHDPAERDGVLALHPGLLVRLDAIARRFEGRRIEILSGHRPNARRGSRHRVGRALDIRVVDVSKEELTEFARTLPETGVGYYPNSRMTHVDVRAASAYWIDRSGPGEPPDYGPWPPSETEVSEVRSRVLVGLAALAALAPDDAESPDASFDGRDADPSASPSSDAPPDPLAHDCAAAPDDPLDPSAPGPLGAEPTPGEATPADEPPGDEPPLTDEEIAALRQQVRAALAALES